MGLHFTKEEFSKRKFKVIKIMKEQNIDALLMFRQESMYWLTGYDTFGYVFFQTLVLDQKGNIILLTLPSRFISNKGSWLSISSAPLLLLILSNFSVSL